MRFQAGSLVILFAAMALAAPVPYDSESTSLDRRAFSREEEIIDLLRRADNAVLSQIHPEHGVSRGQSPARGSAKHHRASGPISPERSTSPSPRRALSLARSHQASSLVADKGESEGGAIQKLVARGNKKNQKKPKSRKKKGKGKKKGSPPPKQPSRSPSPSPGDEQEKNAKGYPTTGGLRLPAQ